MIVAGDCVWYLKYEIKIEMIDSFTETADDSFSLRYKDWRPGLSSSYQCLVL